MPRREKKQTIMTTVSATALVLGTLLFALDHAGYPIENAWRSPAKAETMQRAQVRLDVFVGSEHIGGKAEDLPYSMDITDDVECSFYHSYHSITTVCMKKKEFEIVHKRKVSCKVKEIDGVKVTDPKSKKSYTITWRCINEPDEA